MGVALHTGERRGTHTESQEEKQGKRPLGRQTRSCRDVNPYPTAFPYGNGMVLHFYQQ